MHNPKESGSNPHPTHTNTETESESSMKFILVLLTFGFWDGSVTRNEVGYFSTKADCEKAKSEIMKGANMTYACTEVKQ